MAETTRTAATGGSPKVAIITITFPKEEPREFFAFALAAEEERGMIYNPTLLMAIANVASKASRGEQVLLAPAGAGAERADKYYTKKPVGSGWSHASSREVIDRVVQGERILLTRKS